MQPKILILSSNFNSGDAITALNLFSKWNKDKLFCASLNFGNYTEHFASCYRIGKEEARYMFPFNYLQSLPPSTPAYRVLSSDNSPQKSSFLTRMYKRILMPVLQYTGLYGDRLAIHTSNQFAEWLNQISPNYIYTSVGTLEMAKFVHELMLQFPKIHFIIHTYDNWMEPNYKIALRVLYRHRSETIFKKIIAKASLLFATSNKMAEDYHCRYGKHFITFPNPVAISKVTPRKENHNVLFIGKIGKHNVKSIILMARALQQFNAEQSNPLQFDIYSHVNVPLQRKLKTICADCVFHEWINHDEIPLLLVESKILFLPISINKFSEKFTRYSMSTKMSEFMSSLRPMIYCGPKNIAMTDFLLRNKCSIVITDNKKEYFVQALEKITRKDVAIEKLLLKAEKISRDIFDMETVTARLMQEIESHYKHAQKN